MNDLPENVRLRAVTAAADLLLSLEGSTFDPWERAVIEANVSISQLSAQLLGFHERHIVELEMRASALRTRHAHGEKVDAETDALQNDLERIGRTSSDLRAHIDRLRWPTRLIRMIPSLTGAERLEEPLSRWPLQSPEVPPP